MTDSRRRSNAGILFAVARQPTSGSRGGRYRPLARHTAFGPRSVRRCGGHGGCVRYWNEPGAASHNAAESARRRTGYAGGPDPRGPGPHRRELRERHRHGDSAAVRWRARSRHGPPLVVGKGAVSPVWHPTGVARTRSRGGGRPRDCQPPGHRLDQRGFPFTSANRRGTVPCCAVVDMATGRGNQSPRPTIAGNSSMWTTAAVRATIAGESMGSTHLLGRRRSPWQHHERSAFAAPSSS